MPSSSRLVSRLLTEAAGRHPERTAIVLAEDHLSYAELDAASNQVANLLVSRGVERGDKVALSCPNLPSFDTATSTTTRSRAWSSSALTVPVRTPTCASCRCFTPLARP